MTDSSLVCESLFAAMKRKRVSINASCYVMPLLKEWIEVPDSTVVCLVFWDARDETDISFFLRAYSSPANWLLSCSATGYPFPLQST